VDRKGRKEGKEGNEMVLLRNEKEMGRERKGTCEDKS
jgi:hypothetical protein